MLCNRYFFNYVRHIRGKNNLREANQPYLSVGGQSVTEKYLSTILQL